MSYLDANLMLITVGSGSTMSPKSSINSQTLDLFKSKSKTRLQNHISKTQFYEAKAA